MKTWILILALVGTSCARQIVDNELIVGDGSGADVTITADVGNVNNPKIEYDFVSGAWRFSNDGISFDVFGSAASDVLTTNGDLLYYNSGYQRLGIGTEGQLLTMSSGLPAWIDAPVSTTLDTKGQLQGFSTINAAVGPCADGQTLVYDALEATGWKCGIALPDQTGEAGKYLRTNGTTSAWQNVNNDTADIKTNLLLCPSFEGCGLSTDSWVVTTDAAFDGSGTGTRTIEPSAYNDSELKFEGLISPTWDIKAVMTKTVDFSGQQMKAYCEIRTLRPDVKFIAGANAVSAGEQNVINDNKWRFYEVFLVGGNTSQYIEINGETTASAEPIYIDNCFIGKVSPTDIREVSGAQFVGGAYIGRSNTNDADCSIIPSVTTPILPDFTGCDSQRTINGNISYSISQDRPSYNLNVVAGNRYKITINDLEYKLTGVDAVGCFGYVSIDGGATNNLVRNTSLRAGTSSYLQSQADGTYEFTAEQSGNIVVQYMVSTSSANQCEFGTRLSNYSINIYSFPDSTSNIVTQNTELTAKTANEFVANVSGTGVVSGENFDWIDGNCTQSSGNITCNFNSGIFNAPPVCNVTFDRETDAASTYAERIAWINTVTSSKIYYATSNATSMVSQAVKISCTRSTDYNKSATIIGKFENINSSELVKVEASGNGGQTITSAQNIVFNETNDTSGWFSSNTTITPTKDTWIHIEGMLHINSINNRAIYLNDGTSNIVTCGYEVSSTTLLKFSCISKVEKTKSYTFRPNDTITLQNTTSHYIKITELPDTESIIKNLSNQKTKCQTKYLSAQVSTSGTMSDLTFNNISTGKRYRLYTKGVFLNQSGVEGVISIIHDSNTISTLYSSDYNTTPLKTSSTSDLISFVATNTSITFSATSDGNSRIAGNGTRNNTFAELCELPDTYVETTEW